MGIQEVVAISPSNAFDAGALRLFCHRHSAFLASPPDVAEVGDDHRPGRELLELLGKHHDGEASKEAEALGTCLSPESAVGCRLTEDQTDNAEGHRNAKSKAAGAKGKAMPAKRRSKPARRKEGDPASAVGEEKEKRHQKAKKEQPVNNNRSEDIEKKRQKEERKARLRRTILYV